MTDYSTLRKLLNDQQLDAALITSVANISYLTNYAGFSDVERDAYLLVTKKEAFLFTNPLYSHEVNQKNRKISVIEHSAKKPFAGNLKDIIGKENLKTIGFESDNLSVTEYLMITAQVESRFISMDIRQLRGKKTSEEFEKIQKACNLATSAFALTKKKIKPGVTEIEMATIFELTVRKLGGHIAFPTIVAFGKNAAIPHHHTDTTPLSVSDVVLMDFGVKLDNYCSDTTRTFFVGKQTREQDKVYSTVEKSQQLAIDFITSALKSKQSISAAAVDDEARKHIISAGYPSIPHSLGHGIGIQVHEAPALSPTSKDILSEGTVFSIEPGIYLPNNFGVRIEDLFTIQNGKLLQLTRTSK